MNRGNLKRAVRHHNIVDPFSLSVKQIYEQLKPCKEQCEHFWQYGKQYQRKHLQSRLEAAHTRGNNDVATKIEAIIQ